MKPPVRRRYFQAGGFYVVVSPQSCASTVPTDCRLRCGLFQLCSGEVDIGGRDRLVFAIRAQTSLFRTSMYGNHWILNRTQRKAPPLRGYSLLGRLKRNSADHLHSGRLKERKNSLSNLETDGMIVMLGMLCRCMADHLTSRLNTCQAVSTLVMMQIIIVGYIGVAYLVYCIHVFGQL